VLDNIFSSIARDAIVIGFGDFSLTDDAFDRFNVLTNVKNCYQRYELFNSARLKGKNLTAKKAVSVTNAMDACLIFHLVKKSKEIIHPLLLSPKSNLDFMR